MVLAAVQATDAINMLVDPKKRIRFNVVPSDKLYRCAFSVSALVYFLRYRRAGQETDTLRAYRDKTDLYRAVLDANEVTVERGLRCEGVFNIAEYVLKLGQDLRLDVRGDERFRRSAALWAAHDEYRRAMEKREQRPSRYRYAAVFCGCQAFKGQNLRQCAGARPSASRAIAAGNNWDRHKAVCRRARKPAEAQDSSAVKSRQLL
ncbi:hypothetical protein C8Q80DRAFT_1276514 [Daedaleopsis nitida]|nr:hypothetical protein C8Q80DRAFT_1276514 [Daedaleopsis nitida]